MDITKFKSSLKSKDFGGVYVFAGEEEYLVRYYLSELRRALDIDPSFAVFNNPVFDGNEVDFEALTEAVKSPPMMSDYKLIEWRHANFASMKEKETEALSELIETAQEHPYSILAFTAEGERLEFGTVKRPSAFIKNFGERLNILRFERSTDAQLYSWLNRHFDAMGVSALPDALHALVFRSGRSMDVLLSEAQKLAYLALSRGDNKVNSADVEKVSSLTTESETFALSNAITDRNKEAAFKALDDLKFRRVDPVMIFGMIARTFDEMLAVSLMLFDGENYSSVEETLKAPPLKMPPFKVKMCAAAARKYSPESLSNIVASLAKADADSKYGGVSGYTAIELFLARNL